MKILNPETLEYLNKEETEKVTVMLWNFILDNYKHDNLIFNNQHDIGTYLAGIYTIRKGITGNEFDKSIIKEQVEELFVSFEGSLIHTGGDLTRYNITKYFDDKSIVFDSIYLLFVGINVFKRIFGKEYNDLIR